MLPCPKGFSNIDSVMNTKLSDAQKQLIDDLIANTILPALQEDVCIPNMDDMDEGHPAHDLVYEDRVDVLYGEALNYLKNNLL
jgi:hypothetical protein